MSYIQIPPDSTGKKIKHYVSGAIDIINILSGFDLKRNFLLNKTVRGNTSGAEGIFTGYSSIDSKIFLKDVTKDFIKNEQLTFVNLENNTDVQFAEVDFYETTYIPSSLMVDQDIPSNSMRISDKGSALIRFSEGEQLFDSAGYTQFRNLNTIDTHTFTYISDDIDYFDVKTSGGDIIQEPTQSLLRLIVSSDANSYCSRTSRKYYPYTPGEGNYALMSVAMSDNGKTGVIRKWGLFDESDGFFFKLEDNEFSVNIMSSVNGGIPIRSIPFRDFNGDALTIDINFDKINLYWLDYQWLGAGKVRFGIINPKGERITLHSIENSNNLIRPYAKTGSLPIQWSIENKATTTSSSELRVICCQIATQTGNVKYKPQTFSVSTEAPITLNDSFKNIISFKMAETFNGIKNKIVTIIDAIEFISTQHPIIVELLINADLTGSNFLPHTNTGSAMTIDKSSTSSVGGFVKVSFLLNSGASRREFESTLENSILINPSGAQINYTFRAKCAVPTATTDVWFVGNWKEYR